ncbi:IS110 family transposase [Ramlibacter sp. USB13]|uniref:IS110 family transposase n=1 Tax=Ramlibacter cellulosilyticus TaxID=2764187 RepID=A0A923MWL9_9BURK|nr:IS110 family transposase [Ramlibacter cellulosilyticus]MBC5786411.1 IS110 family transposase [Ramlibacter cellulosilyticus]
MAQEKKLDTIGIDVSKEKLDVALLREQGKFRDKVVANSRKGFQELAAWLAKQDVTKAHVCMEATGAYWEDLAEFLVDAGFEVSVVNPLLIRKFGESLGERSKTDKLDARVIAKFCAQRVPERWQAPSKAIRGLRALVRRREALIGLRTEELNRRDSASEPRVLESISKVIAMLDEQIAEIERQIRQHIDSDPTLKDQRKLLESVPGIGPVLSGMLLSYYGGDLRFATSKQAVAFAGLDTSRRESGTSVRGKPRLSKKGHSDIRGTLYMPAVVAMTRTAWGRIFAGRLAAAGKPPMLVIGAVMRKLVAIAYGVLKSGQPFNPALHAA